MITVRKRIMKMNSSQVSSMEQRWCFGESTRLSTVWPGAPVSRKSRKLFRPEKTFIKLRPANSVKPVFSYVVEGTKIKITVKFRASRRLHFEDTKRIMSPEMRKKSFGTFEKRAPGLFLERPESFRVT